MDATEGTVEPERQMESSSVVGRCREMDLNECEIRDLAFDDLEVPRVEDTPTIALISLELLSPPQAARTYGRAAA